MDIQNLLMIAAQMFQEAERQKLQLKAEELHALQLAEQTRKEALEDGPINAMFDKFDRGGAQGAADGTITADECVGRPFNLACKPCPQWVCAQPA